MIDQKTNDYYFTVQLYCTKLKTPDHEVLVCTFMGKSFGSDINFTCLLLQYL